MTEVNVLDGATLKAGDTDPDLRVQLIEDETSKDVTGYDVTLRVVGANSGEVVVNDPMTIENGREGIVSYSWSSDETEIGELCEAEIAVTDGTETMTFPNDTTFRVVIMETLT